MTRLCSVRNLAWDSSRFRPGPSVLRAWGPHPHTRSLTAASARVTLSRSGRRVGCLGPLSWGRYQAGCKSGRWRRKRGCAWDPGGTGPGDKGHSRGRRPCPGSCPGRCPRRHVAPSGCGAPGVCHPRPRPLCGRQDSAPLCSRRKPWCCERGRRAGRAGGCQDWRGGDGCRPGQGGAQLAHLFCFPAFNPLLMTCANPERQ